MKTLFHAIVLLLMAWCAPLDSYAEVFVLTNGGRIEGEWLNRDSEPVALYDIATVRGGRVSLAADQVAEIIVKSDALVRYEQMLPTISDTVEGHWDMAERCRKAGLNSQRDMHLRRVLELSPDHAEARHALGYSRVNNEWIKPGEWLAEQGYVRYKGAWRLPQEIELETAAERREMEEVEWRKRLKRWRSTITRGRAEGAEALNQLRAVDDVRAVAGLCQMLQEPDETTAMKLIYLEVLGKFDNSQAVAAILERAMTDPVPEIRERSITALRTYGAQQALAALTRGLKDADNKIVNQSAWALGKLGDPAAIPALIDAVVTTHKFTVYPGGSPGGINAGMGSGGGGLTMGGRPRVIERDIQNRDVLAALRVLVPENINFAFNEQAWKGWLAQEGSVPGINLRRW